MKQVFITLLLLSALGLSATAQSTDWTQWGGPQRDFKSASTGLAAMPINDPSASSR